MSPFTSGVSQGDVATNLDSFAQSGGHSTLTQATKTLVNAFISSRVEYCNSAFNGTGAVYLRQIQSVLNAPARLIVKKHKYDQITATIRHDVHWLPVQQKLDYKLCNFMYKCLHQSARRIYHQCVFVLVRSKVIVIFDQQSLVNRLFSEQTIKRTDHAVSLSLVHLF